MIGWAFAVFVLAAFATLTAIGDRPARRWVLLAFSLGFFALAAPLALPPVLALTLVVYLLTRAGRTVGAIVFAAALLATYKAYVAYLGGPPLRAIAEPLVPLGLSYLTFSAIHYAASVRQGRFAAGGFVDFLNFLLFFPTAMAGPIKRYEGFRPTHEAPADRLARGGLRALGGLLKVLVLAPPCRQLVETFIVRQDIGVLDAWLLLYAGAFWLYFDFSGYSDIAIGASRALGYRVPENFNWPYLKTNLRDFWRSWHMSLTSWVRDYVYIPLGGNRRGGVRGALHMAAAMMAIALWHGFAPRFVVFGLYHAAGMFAYILWLKWGPSAANASLPRRVLGALATFHFVSLGWLLFFADTRTVTHVALSLLGLGG